jgi:hypothetical protein
MLKLKNHNDIPIFLVIYFIQPFPPDVSESADALFGIISAGNDWYRPPKGRVIDLKVIGRKIIPADRFMAVFLVFSSEIRTDARPSVTFLFYRQCIV